MVIDLPKSCAVIYKPTGQYMAYDEETNSLYVSRYDEYHIFPAKLRARSAISVTIEMEKLRGKTRPQDDYEIIETQEKLWT